jgi:nicotinate-nucleotide--dimethylbenzimidazole phosphoribosyltransferase
MVAQTVVRGCNYYCGMNNQIVPDSNDGLTKVIKQACSQCGVNMECGAAASACWCQGFSALDINPAQRSCLCENCVRATLHTQRETKRQTLSHLVQAELGRKTMPSGALGALQLLARQLAIIQNTLKPTVKNLGLIVFAADHGLADEGVSAYPKSVTWQMVMNFLGGGAAISVLARGNQIHLQIVDAGVDYEFPASTELVNAKVAAGTKSSLREAAMSTAQFKQAWQSGEQIAQTFIAKQHLQAIGFGEMGIGNTSAASLLLSLLLNIELDTLIGRGTGVNDEQLLHKTKVLKACLERIQASGAKSPIEIATQCAGFEIVMMAGAMRKASDLGVAFVVDGFIATSAYALAHAIDKEVKHYAVFAHCSAEAGHHVVLKALGATALLDLGLRLGEGSGAALAMPLLKNAASIMREMATFESAAVADKA